IYAILHLGSRLQPDAAAPVAPAAVHASATHPGAGPAAPQTAGGGIVRTLVDNVKSPLSLMLLQVIVIVLAARALGTLFLRIGQPPVIGEMIAGILLGPSLLGMVAPGVQSFLFPDASMGALR